MTSPDVVIEDLHGRPLRQQMSYQGAGAGFGGQLRDWSPGLKTADAALLPNLNLGNARADDVVRNNAFAYNAEKLHVDNVVGDRFMLDYMPNWQYLGVKEEDALAYSIDVEQAFLELAEDETGCYLDAERKRTFTMMIRESISTHMRAGEDMFSAEWIPDRRSLIATAIKSVTPKRVCNPGNVSDTATLKGGVETDRYGAAVAYHIRSQNSASFGMGNGMGNTWRRITRETRFGRPKFIHIFEPTEDGQTRGANQFLAVLEQMQMLPKMQQTKLQNAIVNAMYAATIETELGPEAAAALIGGDLGPDKITEYMGAIAAYHDSGAVKMDGVRINHTLPGEVFRLHTSGNADNGYVDLEGSVLRWLAAGLNVPYEPFAKDFRQLSYSAARASLGENWRHYMGRRKVIAARKATHIFRLVLEEMLFRGLVTLPRGAKRDFYQATAAWTNCNWVGSGRLSIDELKETKAAELRMGQNLSTLKEECALLGKDYRKVLEQKAREQKEIEALKLAQ